MPATKMGRLVAVCISATSTGEGVSSVMSQAPPTFCIHVPMYETTDAVQSARNSESASGSSADVARPSVSLGLAG